MASGITDPAQTPGPPRSGNADVRTPRPARIGVFAAVTLLHLIAVALLIRAFAPDFTAAMSERVVSTFSVTVATAPTPPPPTPRKVPKPAASAGSEAPKAVARAVIAPPPRIVLAAAPAPRAPATGAANAAGSGSQGSGTGASGSGAGPGAGTGGTGAVGGMVTKPVKIAGDINSARDYPAATRDLRIGEAVVVIVTVGTDGRARNCRVRKHSRDAQADAITCALVVERFRFRPATDAAGKPVEAAYGWQQRWYYNAPG